MIFVESKKNVQRKGNVNEISILGDELISCGLKKGIWYQMQLPNVVAISIYLGSDFLEART